MKCDIWKHVVHSLISLFFLHCQPPKYTKWFGKIFKKNQDKEEL